MTPWHTHETCHHTTYFLTCEEFDRLVAFARNRCQICRKPAEECEPTGKLHIDHDHRYGNLAVRGLLCPSCNALMTLVDSGIRYDPRANFYCQNAWFVKRLNRLRDAELRNPENPYEAARPW